MSSNEIIEVVGMTDNLIHDYIEAEESDDDELLKDDWDR